MSIAENEALASLRILVVIAHADGTVHADERRSLAAALQSLELPAGTTVDQLLRCEGRHQAEASELRSEEARDQDNRSAYFMAHADGTCTKEEQSLLDRIGEAVGASAETKSSLERVFVGRGRASGAASGLASIQDRHAPRPGGGRAHPALRRCQRRARRFSDSRRRDRHRPRRRRAAARDDW